MIKQNIWFYNKVTKQFQHTIWNELKNGLWADFNIENFIANSLLPPTQLISEKSLFPTIQQIPYGTRWNVDTMRLEYDLYRPVNMEVSVKNILSETERFITLLGAKRIGVHLSGGFDSSLIIALLRALNIPYIPIGLQCDNHEFRTEKCIQQIILGWNPEGRLINIQEFPFYSKLSEVPAHQIPDPFIKSYASANALALEFEKNGCDVVLTGQGADALFVNAIHSFNDVSFNIEDEFRNHAEEELIYSPRGIRLVPFFSHKPFINMISTARFGQEDDPLKLWARNYFKDLLPTELVDYSYCANFSGLTMRGLHEAKPIIKELMEEAFERTNNHYFSPRSIKYFLSLDVFDFEYYDYIRFCSLISIVVWFHSLFRYEENINIISDKH